jgi:hypothetical protein
MTRFGRQKRSGGARSGRIVPERKARLPRLGPQARSKTNEMRATGCLAAIVAEAAGDGFGWNAPLACVRQVRASSPRFCERNTARTAAVERSASCAGATTQRRSGIVRRLAEVTPIDRRILPRTARRGQSVLKGKKPQERRSIANRLCDSDVACAT